jgi:hypothetical protein
MELVPALLETSLFLPPFVLHVQPFRLVSTSCRSLLLVEAVTTNIFVNRLLASVGNCDGAGWGCIKPYGDVER